MPLDLFAISRGLNSYQDAKKKGQADVAEQYLSEIENSLKIMASAQGIRQSAELYPLQLRQEQAKAQYAPEKLAAEVETEKQQGYSYEQLGKGREIKAKTDEQIFNALQSGYSKYQTENKDSKLSYNEWLYQNYPDLGPASEKAREAVKTQEETTKLRTAQTLGATQSAEVNKQKVEAGMGEISAYAETGTTKGKVIAGTEIAQMEKAKSDAEISGVKLKYADQQAKATLDATQARAEKSAETGGYTVSQWADDVGIIDRQIDTLNNRNSMINRTLAYLSKSSTMDEFINAVAAQSDTELTSVAGQVADATSLEEAKRGLLADKSANLERINYWNSRKSQLNRLAGMPEEPKIQTKVTVEPAKEQTITPEQTGTFPYEKFNKLPQDQRRAMLKENALRGIKRLDLTDKDNGVITEIKINQQPNGDYYFSGAISWKLLKNQTPKPAQEPAVQGQPNPKVQAVMQSLKQKGITSINQLEPDIIQTLKAQGIYDQVRKLLGG